MENVGSGPHSGIATSEESVEMIGAGLPQLSHDANIWLGVGAVILFYISVWYIGKRIEKRKANGENKTATGEDNR